MGIKTVSGRRSYVVVGLTLAVLLMSGTLAFAKDEKAGSTAKKEQETLRDWWVNNIKIENVQGKKNLFGAKMLIASFDAELIKNLTSESWELLKGKNGSSTGIVTIDLWKDLDDKIMPNCQILLLGGSEDKNADHDINDFLTASIRLKGEKTWLRLSDFIKVNEDKKGYEIYRCTRCFALTEPNAQICSTCNAKLS